MAIVQTITESSFIDAFMQSSRKDQFSYEALRCIFEYLEEYSDSTGEDVELDIIAICCDWVEMTWQEAAEAYDIDLSDFEDDEEKADAVWDFLTDESAGCYRVGDESFVFVQF